MRRVVTIVAALNSLLIVPALCMGGVITHACECVEETCCPTECDCDDRSGCGHESGCSDDPCSVVVVRPQRQGDDVAAVSSPVVFTTIIQTAVTQTSVQTVRAGLYEWPGGKMLPLPPSDLPLLI